MNQLQVFNHQMFGNLPVVVVDGKEYFGATDVAESLEYKQPHTAVTNHCDLDGVITYNVIDRLGRNQEKKFITLGNVSRLIIVASKQSKNIEIQKKAKKYEKWIFDEVIPSIHKHGGYISTTDEDDDASIMAKALLIANKTIEQKQNKILEQQKVIDQQKPKVLFATAVETSESSVLIGELAKIIKQNGVDIGQKRLFQWLRDNGYLCKQKGESYNLPTQRGMEMNIFEIKKQTINNPDGSIRTTRTTKVTGKGQIYFVNKFLSEREGHDATIPGYPRNTKNKT